MERDPDRNGRRPRLKSAILKAYWAAPSPVRDLLASAWGLRLRAWRYGPETDALVAEALERETWSPERWTQWGQDRLARTLHGAAERVPFYREMWSRRRQAGFRGSVERVENWPILTKEQLRSNPRAFVADDRHVARLYRERSSGTTGKPITVWWDRATVRGWFALFEARGRQWNGVSRTDRWAILGGQPVVPAAQRNPPYWIRNRGLRQLYLSANHVSPENAAAYGRALERFGPTHLIAYSTSAALLAGWLEESGAFAPHLRVVLTNSEGLSAQHRATIARGFRCEVRETYGMAEIVAGATECASGSLHLWPELGWLECLSDTGDEPAAPDSSGRLVATSLLNAAMPLVRYEIGDRGRLAPPERQCGCGRSLRMLAALEGRSHDVLLAPDGRRVYWINPVFYGQPVREAQVVQEAVDKLRVRYVPAPEFGRQAMESIRGGLRDRVGDVEIEFEAFDKLPRDAGGKLRAVVSRLGGEARP